MLLTTTHTVKDVTDLVKRQFGDESGVQLTDLDLIRWINAGQMEIASKNSILTGKAITDLIADQKDYAFTLEKIIKIDALHVDDKPVQYMQFPDVEQYISENDVHRDKTGQPEVWYSYAGQITFWPKPDKDIAGGIVIYYVKEPDRVEDLTDTLTIPDRYFNLLCQYVLSQAFEMDEDWQAAAAKSEQFNGNLLNLSEAEANMSSQTYPTITTYDW